MAEDKPDVPEEVVAAGAVANVMQYLKGIQFPAYRADLERKAVENGADYSAMEEILRLPTGRRFDDVGEVIKAIGDEVAGL